jgi:hypothetical protein
MRFAIDAFAFTTMSRSTTAAETDAGALGRQALGAGTVPSAASIKPGEPPLAGGRAGLAIGRGPLGAEALAVPGTAEPVKSAAEAPRRPG